MLEGKAGRRVAAAAFANASGVRGLRAKNPKPSH